MSSPDVLSARRNAWVMGATALVVGGLFLVPSSTNDAGSRGFRPHRSPTGVVPAAPAAGGPVAASATVVVNGTAADTPYGPVQVQIRLRNGRVQSAAAITSPQGGQTDRAINSRAIPVLDREAVAAQSARIDTVSGATYTSGGYLQSLQAALDTAHL